MVNQYMQSQFMEIQHHYNICCLMCDTGLMYHIKAMYDASRNIYNHLRAIDERRDYIEHIRDSKESYGYEEDEHYIRG